MKSKFKAMLPSLLAVFIAMTIGAIIIAVKGVNPFIAYGDMFQAAFYQATPRAPFMSGLAKTLLAATPLIFTALAVMFAFRAGMFNIGVQGQMAAGGLGAVIIGVYFGHFFGSVTAALIAAAIFGFCWAALAGFLKARFGVHEVISTIMLNYIMVELQNFLLNNPFRDVATQNIQTPKVDEYARLTLLFYDVTKQNLNMGFILAIASVFLVDFFFKKTRLGYEMKAVGYNETAAENAGISTKWVTIIAIGLSGALAGLGGAERVLGGAAEYAYSEPIMGDLGFTGLAVALLGKNNPYGILAAAIFYAALDVGGRILQSTHRLDREIVTIVQALIIIFVAGENFFKYLLAHRKKH